MDLRLITQWWNLVFLLPLVLAVLYLGVSVMTGMGMDHGDADVDADADVDGDVDVHADVDTDVDADAETDFDHVLSIDADHDLGADHDADAGHGAESDHDAATGASADGSAGLGALASTLAWLGAGAVPLSFAIVLLLLAWGLVGLIANQCLINFSVSEWLIPLVSIPAAAMVSLMLVHLVGRLVRKYSPSKGAQRRDALVGLTGEAITEIDDQFGLVVLRGNGGDLFQVPCRVSSDRAKIEKGMRVLLVDYNKNGGFFLVQPDELSATTRQLPQS